MGLDSMRGSYYGRCPPILVGALILICLVLMFNWWSSSTQNNDLIKQLNDLSEQLKISSEEQERCARQRSAFENQIKSSEEESAQLRVKLEQQRTDTEEYKKQLSAKDDEIKAALKSKDDCESSVTRCTTELESLKKLDISKDGVIASLRIEKIRLNSDVAKHKQTALKLEEDLKQVQKELMAAKNGMNNAANPVTSNLPEVPKHTAPDPEYTPEVENPEKDDNNAAERGDIASNNKYDEDNAAEKGDEGNEEMPPEAQDDYAPGPGDDEGTLKKPNADANAPVNGN